VESKMGRYFDESALPALVADLPAVARQ